jgi:RPA family protein
MARYLMRPEEVEEIRSALQKKWDYVNKEYQTITHIRMVDTQGLKRQKERCEHELAQIEKDLEKLNKTYIFVDYQY